MMCMNKEVNEAISALEESIANKHKLIELLKQFEQISETGLSETDYHTFCETNMRNSDSLGKALVKVFPFLTYEKKGANYFFFRIQEEGNAVKGFTVKIPSFRANCCVDIVVDEYYRDENDFRESLNMRYDMVEDRCKSEIAKKEEFLSTRSVFKRSRIIYPYVHPIIAFFPYIFSSIGRNRNQEMSDELVGLYKKQKEVAAKKSELVRQNEFDREAQQAILSRYIPLFLEWTDTVLVYQKGWEREAAKFTREQMI